jgi:hypothetical protein
VIQPFIIAKKQKKTENKNKDAPRKTHSIWSNKNSFLKDDLIFLLMKKGMP